MNTVDENPYCSTPGQRWHSLKLCPGTLVSERLQFRAEEFPSVAGSLFSQRCLFEDVLSELILLSPLDMCML